MGRMHVEQTDWTDATVGHASEALVVVDIVVTAGVSGGGSATARPLLESGTGLQGRAGRCSPDHCESCNSNVHDWQALLLSALRNPATFGRAWRTIEFKYVSIRGGLSSQPDRHRHKHAKRDFFKVDDVAKARIRLTSLCTENIRAAFNLAGERTQYSFNHACPAAVACAAVLHSAVRTTVTPTVRSVGGIKGDEGQRGIVPNVRDENMIRFCRRCHLVDARKVIHLQLVVLLGNPPRSLH